MSTRIELHRTEFAGAAGSITSNTIYSELQKPNTLYGVTPAMT